MSTETATKTKTYTLEEILAQFKGDNNLMLWNDEVNTFDHVIFCLIEFLEYSSAEAERIAWTVHTKGKEVVLQGSREELIPFRDKLQEQGLSVSIE